MNHMNANDESVMVTKPPNVAEDNVFDASSLENTVDICGSYYHGVPLFALCASPWHFLAEDLL